MAALFAKAYADSLDMVMYSVIWGVVVPTIFAIVSGVVYWVYRGFKPKVAHGE